LFLFITDHSHHLNNTIQPHLNKNHLVISDRYIDSRCAYQAHTLSSTFESPVKKIYDYHKDWSVIPDLTLYLDVTVETALKRVSSGEKYETEERLTSIKENYETLVNDNNERFVTVDAEQPIERVVEKCVETIKNHQ
jgi:dTMP kinase